MTEPHSALVVMTPTASGGQASGASLRALAVRLTLEQAGYVVTTGTGREMPSHADRFCVGVAVSFASAGAIRRLRSIARRTWLDATDSWLLLNGTAMIRGRPLYLARALRDGLRLASMPTPDLVTWISGADLAADHGTVRGGRRLVLPWVTTPIKPLANTGRHRRAVVAADWRYPPNRDGLSWFSSRVAPYLSVDIEVYGPGLERVALAPKLVARGYVPDGAELYRKGDVHIAPVRYGAGVKHKVLEPLLAGLPVITTPTGAHGLRSHPLLEVHRREEPFAAAVTSRLAQEMPDCGVDGSQVVDRDDTEQVLSWLRACPGHS